MTSTIFPLMLRGHFEEDDRRFTLESDFIYNDPEQGIMVVVPAGFTTDWNSVPKLLWGYFAPWEYPEAGLVHDWLYRAPNAFSSPILTPPLTRQQCDDIHRRILDLKGCRWTKRQVIYLALRAGGALAWNAHRKEDPRPLDIGVAFAPYTSPLQNSPSYIGDENCKSDADHPQTDEPADR